MNMAGEYQWMRKVLRNMDEKQLIELFHDLEDLETVERIADCAYHFVENFHVECEEIAKSLDEKSDEQDWKEQDDAQRYRDIKSTQDSYR